MMQFVKNAWYVACLVSELGDRPLGRTILGIPVVLFRTQSGKVHALTDNCPHRAVPLHRGEVVGERIRCVYHGLEFDGEGVCRLNPHISGSPERLKGRSFPLAERYGMVWIWPGDAPPDMSRLPDYPAFEAPDRYAVGHGYTWVGAEYRLMIDNLFDLSHAEYIHADSVGVPGAHRVAEHKVIQGEDWVKIHFNIPDMPPAAVWHAAWNRSERMDQHASMIWTGGGSCYLDLCITPPGLPASEGWNLPFLHLLTPETEKSTHYFWAMARDFDVDNPALTAAIVATSAKAFADEDKPILEAAQRMLEIQPVHLRNFTVGDAASRHIRRMLARASAQEAAAQTADMVVAEEL